MLSGRDYISIPPVAYTIPVIDVIDENILRLDVVTDSETSRLDFPVHRIICAGYSGRSRETVQEHVKELVALGMPAPETTPIFFQVSTYLATTGTGITVQDRLTSGEVEFVLLFGGGETYVTCGSDHTHRALERVPRYGAALSAVRITGVATYRSG